MASIMCSGSLKFLLLFTYFFAQHVSTQEFWQPKIELRGVGQSDGPSLFQSQVSASGPASALGGFHLSLGTKSFETIAKTVEEVSNDVLGHLEIPDFHDEGNSLLDHRLINFQPLRVQMKPSKTGLIINITWPQFEASSKFRADGKFEFSEVLSIVKNVTVKLIVKLKGNVNGKPLLDLPTCSADVGHVDAKPKVGSGTLESKVHLLFIEKAFKTQLTSSVCGVVKFAISAINEAFLSFGHPNFLHLPGIHFEKQLKKLWETAIKGGIGGGSLTDVDIDWAHHKKDKSKLLEILASIDKDFKLPGLHLHKPHFNLTGIPGHLIKIPGIHVDASKLHFISGNLDLIHQLPDLHIDLSKLDLLHGHEINLPDLKFNRSKLLILSGTIDKIQELRADLHIGEPKFNLSGIPGHRIHLPDLHIDMSKLFDFSGVIDKIHQLPHLNIGGWKLNFSGLPHHGLEFPDFKFDKSKLLVISGGLDKIRQLPHTDLSKLIPGHKIELPDWQKPEFPDIGFGKLKFNFSGIPGHLIHLPELNIDKSKLHVITGTIEKLLQIPDLHIDFSKLDLLGKLKDHEISLPDLKLNHSKLLLLSGMIDRIHQLPDGHLGGLKFNISGIPGHLLHLPDFHIDKSNLFELAGSIEKILHLPDFHLGGLKLDFSKILGHPDFKLPDLKLNMSRLIAISGGLEKIFRRPGHHLTLPDFHLPKIPDFHIRKPKFNLTGIPGHLIDLPDLNIDTTKLYRIKGIIDRIHQFPDLHIDWSKLKQHEIHLPDLKPGNLVLSAIIQKIEQLPDWHPHGLHFNFTGIPGHRLNLPDLKIDLSKLFEFGGSFDKLLRLPDFNLGGLKFNFSKILGHPDLHLPDLKIDHSKLLVISGMLERIRQLPDLHIDRLNLSIPNHKITLPDWHIEKPDFPKLHIDLSRFNISGIPGHLINLPQLKIDPAKLHRITGTISKIFQLPDLHVDISKFNLSNLPAHIKFPNLNFNRSKLLILSGIIDGIHELEGHIGGLKFNLSGIPGHKIQIPDLNIDWSKLFDFGGSIGKIFHLPNIDFGGLKLNFSGLLERPDFHLPNLNINMSKLLVVSGALEKIFQLPDFHIDRPKLNISALIPDHKIQWPDWHKERPDFHIDFSKFNLSGIPGHLIDLPELHIDKSKLHIISGTIEKIFQLPDLHIDIGKLNLSGITGFPVHFPNLKLNRSKLLIVSAIIDQIQELPDLHIGGLKFNFTGIPGHKIQLPDWHLNMTNWFDFGGSIDKLLHLPDLNIGGLKLNFSKILGHADLHLPDLKFNRSKLLVISGALDKIRQLPDFKLPKINISAGFPDKIQWPDFHKGKPDFPDIHIDLSKFNISGIPGRLLNFKGLNIDVSKLHMISGTIQKLFQLPDLHVDLSKLNLAGLVGHEIHFPHLQLNKSKLLVIQGIIDRIDQLPDWHLGGLKFNLSGIPGHQIHLPDFHINMSNIFDIAGSIDKILHLPEFNLGGLTFNLSALLGRHPDIHLPDLKIDKSKLLVISGALDKIRQIPDLHIDFSKLNLSGIPDHNLHWPDWKKPDFPLPDLNIGKSIFNISGIPGHLINIPDLKIDKSKLHIVSGVIDLIHQIPDLHIDFSKLSLSGIAGHELHLPGHELHLPHLNFNKSKLLILSGFIDRIHELPDLHIGGFKFNLSGVPGFRIRLPDLHMNKSDMFDFSGLIDKIHHLPEVHIRGSTFNISGLFNHELPAFPGLKLNRSRLLILSGALEKLRKLPSLNLSIPDLHIDKSKLLNLTGGAGIKWPDFHLDKFKLNLSSLGGGLNLPDLKSKLLVISGSLDHIRQITGLPIDLSKLNLTGIFGHKVDWPDLSIEKLKLLNLSGFAGFNLTGIPGHLIKLPDIKIDKSKLHVIMGKIDKILQLPDLNFGGKLNLSGLTGHEIKLPDFGKNMSLLALLGKIEKVIELPDGLHVGGLKFNLSGIPGHELNLANMLIDFSKLHDLSGSIEKIFQLPDLHFGGLKLNLSGTGGHPDFNFPDLDKIKSFDWKALLSGKGGISSLADGFHVDKSKNTSALFCGVLHRIHDQKELDSASRGLRSYLAGELVNVTKQIEGLAFKLHLTQDGGAFSKLGTHLNVQAGFVSEDDDEPIVGFSMPAMPKLPPLPQIALPPMPPPPPMPPMPQINLPTMPQIQIPTLPPMPQVKIPTLPQFQMPTMPHIQVPTAPPFHMPTMPHFQVPTLPPFHMPTLPPFGGLPTMPSIHLPTWKPIGLPTLPSIHLPSLPPMHLPTLPPFQFPTLHPLHLPTIPWFGHRGRGDTTDFPLGPSDDSGLCFAVRDEVVNSFMNQAHAKKFFNTTLNVTKEDIPDPVWNLLKVAFRDQFQMVFQLETEEAPVFHFNRRGGYTTAKVSTHFGVQTGWHHSAEKVVDASADIDVGVRIYIENHSVKSQISLGPSPNIRLHKIFLTGLMDNVASDLINLILNKVVWPHIERKFNEMMGVGIRIPTPCGMSFLDPSIVNTEGALKLCANIKYNKTGLIDRIKGLIGDKKKPSPVTLKPLPVTDTPSHVTGKPIPPITEKPIVVIPGIFHIGDKLQPGTTQKSKNGDCSFTNQQNGNVVILHTPTQFASWTSRTVQTTPAGAAVFEQCGLSIGGKCFGLNKTGFSLKEAILEDPACRLNLVFANSQGKVENFILGNIGKVSVLPHGLVPGEALFSANMNFAFSNEDSGNLVLYRLSDLGHSRRIILDAGRHGQPLCNVEKSSTEKVVLCLGMEISDRMTGQPLWMTLSDLGLLRFVDDGGISHKYKNFKTNPIFEIGDRFFSGDYSLSANGLFQLTLRADGSAIIVHKPSGFIIWNSNTHTAGVDISFEKCGLMVGTKCFGLNKPGFNLKRASLENNGLFVLLYGDLAGHSESFTLGNIGRGSVLPRGIAPGEAVFSPSLNYMFANELTGNLALYQMSASGHDRRMLLDALRQNKPPCVVEKAPADKVVKCLNVEVSEHMTGNPVWLKLDDLGLLQFIDDAGRAYRYANFQERAIFRPGDRLFSGENATSPKGSCIIQTLASGVVNVLHVASGLSVWGSNTQKPGAFASFEECGMSIGGKCFGLNKPGFEFKQAQLQDNCAFVLSYQDSQGNAENFTLGLFGRAPVAAPGLAPGMTLWSPSMNYAFVNQMDGDLVLYQLTNNGRALRAIYSANRAKQPLCNVERNATSKVVTCLNIEISERMTGNPVWITLDDTGLLRFLDDAGVAHRYLNLYRVAQFILGDRLFPGDIATSSKGNCLMSNKLNDKVVIQHVPTKYLIWDSKGAKLGVEAVFDKCGLNIGGTCYGSTKPGNVFKEASLNDHNCGLLMVYVGEKGALETSVLGRIGKVYIVAPGMGPGEAVFSTNMQYMLANQPDGNLVLVKLSDGGRTARPLYHANRVGRPQCTIEKSSSQKAVNCLDTEISERMTGNPLYLTLSDNGRIQFTDDTNKVYHHRNFFGIFPLLPGDNLFSGDLVATGNSKCGLFNKPDGMVGAVHLPSNYFNWISTTWVAGAHALFQTCGLSISGKCFGVHKPGFTFAKATMNDFTCALTLEFHDGQGHTDSVTYGNIGKGSVLPRGIGPGEAVFSTDMKVIFANSPINGDHFLADLTPSGQIGKMLWRAFRDGKPGCVIEVDPNINVVKCFREEISERMSAKPHYAIFDPSNNYFKYQDANGKMYSPRGLKKV